MAEHVLAPPAWAATALPSTAGAVLVTKLPL